MTVVQGQNWDSDLCTAVDAAIRNVVEFGDTDLFADPIEAHWLRQAPDQARLAVLALHERFVQSRPGKPEALRALFSVGYSGYRLGTQIDPVWNLYLLSLVILAGPAIEAARAPRSQAVVFSFRFIAPDERGRVFDPECGWRAFTHRALQLAETHAQAVVCDLSDFYHRIGPATAQLALERARVEPALARRIGRVLRALGADRMGLPVGGPASRLIAESVLCQIDDQLDQTGVVFCRFVDDIRLFTATRDASLHYLALLSRELMLRGFSLQKSKTRIMPGRELAAELVIGHRLNLGPSKGPVGGGSEVAELQRLLLASTQFDPYSGLRAQRDARLQAFAQHSGALPHLRREFSKSRVNPAVARNMLAALAYMPVDEVEQAMLFLLDARRQAVVLPVVGKLLTVAGEQLGRLGEAAQRRLRDSLLTLLKCGGTLLHLPSSQAQALRVLQALPPDGDPDSHAHWKSLFSQSTEPLVRREVLLLWGAWDAAGALHALTRGPRLRTGWERRALAWAIVMSQAPVGLKAKWPRLVIDGRTLPGPCDMPWARWLAASAAITGAEGASTYPVRDDAV